MKKEKSCGAIIFYNNQVLLIKQHQRFWGFPKGHIEDGETEVETAIREVKEETNVDIVVEESLRFENHYITDTNIDKTVIFFVAHPIDNMNIVAQEAEIKDVKWIDAEKVEETLTFDNLKELWRTVYQEVIEKNVKI